MSLRDGARLALGTLTVVPVRPPRRVDAAAGSWAMTLAPLVGLLLAVPCAGLLWVAHELAAPAPVTAVLVVGLLALLTRALHLDGLADTADGLGSARPPEQALEIMRRSDIGPFGVTTLVLLLMLQVLALSDLVASDDAGPALTAALVASRLALPVACSRGMAAARTDGLGHAVADSVGRPQLVLSVALSAVTVGVLAGVAAVVLLPAGALAGLSMCFWCRRRLGGVTGDVLGACVEVSFTAALVLATVL